MVEALGLACQGARHSLWLPSPPPPPHDLLDQRPEAVRVAFLWEAALGLTLEGR